MLRISISTFTPKGARLTGAAIGDAHVLQLKAQVAAKPPADETLVFDFAGIESASASYLKRLFQFLADGNDAGMSRMAPIVVNVESDDLIEDLQDYLEGKERVLVMAELTGDSIRFQRLLGRLDGAAHETYTELKKRKQTTAQQLYDDHRTRTTNQTAWNNRLAQLVELGVARRRREGRFWIYQPTVTT